MIPTSVTDFARDVFAELTKSRLASIISGVVSTLLLSTVYQILVESQGTTVLLTVGLLILALILLGVAVKRARNRAAPGVTPITRPRKALMVLVSTGKVETAAALAAIKYHHRGEDDQRPEPTLEHLWLIHSREYPEPLKPPQLSSYDMAAELERRYKPLLKDVIPVSINNIDDPYEVYQKAGNAFNYARSRLKLDPDEIVADLTGGTKSMTIGLAYAGIPVTRNLEFMKPRAYLDNGYADGEAGSDPYRLDVDFVPHEYGLLK